jgi:uncharacterized protein HemX
MDAPELKRLEIEARLARLAAVQAASRAKVARLEHEHSMLAPPMPVEVPQLPRSSGSGKGLILTVVLVAAAAGLGWVFHTDTDIANSRQAQAAVVAE